MLLTVDSSKSNAQTFDFNNFHDKSSETSESTLLKRPTNTADDNTHLPRKDIFLNPH